MITTIDMKNMPVNDADDMCMPSKLAFRELFPDGKVKINRESFRKFLKGYKDKLKYHCTYNALYGVNCFLNDMGFAPYPMLSYHTDFKSYKAIAGLDSYNVQESKIYNALKDYLLS